MNIIEATKYLDLGKRIRRKSWICKTNYYMVHQNSNVVHDEKSNKIYYDIPELLAEDWEIFGEKTMENQNQTFEGQLRELINRNSKENESNTPDFILAQFLNECLGAFNTATRQLEITTSATSGIPFSQEKLNKAFKETEDFFSKEREGMDELKNKMFPPYADQIVAFLSKHRAVIVSRNEDGTFGKQQQYKITDLLGNQELEIYTVRNSKGEEFSIGDETIQGEILRFSFRYSEIDNGLCAITKDLNVLIDYLQKKRTPIITVEGKELFEGDEVWYLFQPLIGEQIPAKQSVIKGLTSNGNGNYFLTKESADQWIRDNKKSISYQELKDYCLHGVPSPNDARNILNHFRP